MFSPFLKLLVCRTVTFSNHCVFGFSVPNRLKKVFRQYASYILVASISFYFVLFLEYWRKRTCVKGHQGYFWGQDWSRRKWNRNQQRLEDNKNYLVFICVVYSLSELNIYKILLHFMSIMSIHRICLTTPICIFCTIYYTFN